VPCSCWEGEVQLAGRFAAPNDSAIRGPDLWAGDRFRLEGLVDGFLRCRVCGRSGEHKCSLVASFSPLSSRHWGFRRRRFDGVLLSHQGSKRWGCGHDHRDPDEAGSCAEAALDRFQSGASALVEPPWADDEGFDATAAGVRASVSGLGGREFEALCEIFGRRCRYCGIYAELVQDHAVPLGRGGENWAGNVVPACAQCNQRKGTATEDEYASLIARSHGRVPRRISKKVRSRHAEWSKAFPREARAVTLRREVVSKSILAYLSRYGEITEALLATTEGQRSRDNQRKVAGVSFHQADLRAVARRGEWNGRVVMVPCNDNEYDRTAVEIRRGTRTLGFLPKALAAEVHGALVEAASQGRAVAASARIFETQTGDLSAVVRFARPLVIRAP